MFTNSAYKNNSENAEVNFSESLIVSSCGIYQVFSGPTVFTERPKGRNDWQLLYIESGEVSLVINDKTQIVKKDSIILFPPQQPQFYYYHKSHKPVIYWVHFSGRDVEKILNHYKITSTKNVFYIGGCFNLPTLFKQILNELQLRNEKYEEMAVYKLREIFLHINRALNNSSIKNNDTSTIINSAKLYFNENYNQDINIQNYASSLNMSACWFIQKFKELTGVTPTQYILNIRLTTAKNLLKYSKYNISETALAVGYSNSFYFSRLFTKHIGISPSAYKKLADNSTK